MVYKFSNIKILKSSRKSQEVKECDTVKTDDSRIDSGIATYLNSRLGVVHSTVSPGKTDKTRFQRWARLSLSFVRTRTRFTVTWPTRDIQPVCTRWYRVITDWYRSLNRMNPRSDASSSTYDSVRATWKVTEGRLLENLQRNLLGKYRVMSRNVEIQIKAFYFTVQN